MKKVMTSEDKKNSDKAMKYKGAYEKPDRIAGKKTPVKSGDGLAAKAPKMKKTTHKLTQPHVTKAKADTKEIDTRMPGRPKSKRLK